DADVLPTRDSAPNWGSEDVRIGLPVGLTLRYLEEQYILQTLASVGGNRTEAARLLGISLRCLQYKLKAYREARLRHRSLKGPAREHRPNREPMGAPRATA
ncbi:MAG TPA: helix-turn-helix domain-containing protein, partial [Methylomirabilota bacterium]